MLSIAPPSPAMNPEMANAVTRARVGEMPIDWLATSLPRRAASVRPTVPVLMALTA